MITNAEVKILLAGSRYLELVNQIKPQLEMVRNASLSTSGMGSIMRIWSNRLRRTRFYSDIEDEAITLLMYTSGTTGRPKGVP